MKTLHCSVIIIVLFACLATARAQDDLIVSSRMFGDYYVIAGNHNKELVGENSFWMRRIYLTFDQNLTDGFSYRLRFEFNTPGDFKTKSKIEPYIKSAYIRWTKNNHNIFFGLSLTPFAVVAERFWEYRAVELPAVSLMRFGTSRDFGISFQGSFDDNRKLSYHFMVANGSSTRSESGKGKKVMFSLVYRSGSGIIVEGITDFEDREQGKRRITWKTFAAVERKTFRIGMVFSQQRRRVGRNVEDEKLEVFSIIGARMLVEKIWLFARYDRYFDPNPAGKTIPYIPFDPTARSQFVNAGIDFKVGPDISVIPNIEAVFYDKTNDGTKPATDVIPRITLFFRVNESR